MTTLAPPPCGPLALGDPEDLNRALENERALNALLRAVLTRASLPEILDECLEVLLSMSWLSVLPKGGVFVAEPEAETLTLVAHRNLSPEMTRMCARVPFGVCLCGRAAATRRLIQTRCVDHRHELHYEGMTAHGHYNVPILDGGGVVGVLVLYLPHGHPGAESERRFLSAVADMLSMVIRQKRMEQELRGAVRQLEMLAHVDSLTELYNRRFLLRRLAEEAERAACERRAVSLLMVDVDHFKAVNDCYGHHAGDETLRVIGHRLRSGVRGHDVVARYGGEEFCLLLPETDAPAALEAAERARLRVERETVRIAREAEVAVTVSIGVAQLSPRETVEEVMGRADEALYCAKRLGRNRVELAPEAGPRFDAGR